MEAPKTEAFQFSLSKTTVRKNAIKGIVISTLVLALSVYAARLIDDSRVWVLYLATAIMGCAEILFIKSLLAPKGVLVLQIDSAGLTSTYWGGQTLAWADLKSADTKIASRLVYLSIEMENEDGYLKKLGARGVALASNRMLDVSPFAIPLSVLDKKSQLEIAAYFEKMNSFRAAA